MDTSDLSFDNEFRKLKLMAENGAIFSNGSSIPPDMEKEFLDRIELFERQYEKRDLISVYEFIGKPEYRKNIPEVEIQNELERLLEYMAQNHISLSFLDDVFPQELYRYITEELFENKVDNVKMDGMRYCFTYEDFYPNHAYDIKRYTSELIDIIFKGNSEEIKYITSASFKAISGKPVTESQLIYIIECFQKQYWQFRVNELNISEPQISNGYAIQEIAIEWEDKCTSSGRIEKHAGKGVIDFIQEFDFWYICGINFPGMEI